jgi:hypothetical protein
MREMPGCHLVPRRWFCRGICSVPFALAMGCREEKEPRIINLSDLQKIQIGDVVRLSELLKQPAEKICFLSPYRDRLQESEPLSHQVNAHLKAMGLMLQDGGFALVSVNGDKVSVQRLSGARQYIVAWHEGAGRILKPLGCANADRVLVTKVHDLWPALVFGEER